MKHTKKFPSFEDALGASNFKEPQELSRNARDPSVMVVVVAVELVVVMMMVVVVVVVQQPSASPSMLSFTYNASLHFQCFPSLCSFSSLRCCPCGSVRVRFKEALEAFKKPLSLQRRPQGFEGLKKPLELLKKWLEL